MNRLLLMGAGAASLELIRYINRNNPGDFSMTLVNPWRYQVNPGFVTSYLSDSVEFKDISLDLRGFTLENNTELIEDSVVKINSEPYSVSLSGGGVKRFDFAVINTGAVPPKIPGEGIIYVRPAMNLVDFKIDVTGSPSSSVTVIGSGAGACETAMAVSSLSNKRNLGLKVKLIVPGEHAGEELLINGRRIMEKELNASEIEVVKNSKIREIRDNIIYLTDGRCIYSDFVLGAENSLENGLELEGFLKPGDKIMTDRFLRSSGMPGIYAAGDMISPEGFTGRRGVFHTFRETEIIRENLLREIKGKPLIEYNPSKSAFTMISLPGDRAFIETSGMDFTGKIPGYFKKYMDRKLFKGRG